MCVIITWKVSRRIYGTSDLAEQGKDSPLSYRLDVIVTFYDMAQ